MFKEQDNKEEVSAKIQIPRKLDLTYYEGKLAKDKNNAHFLRVNIVINQRLKNIAESKKKIE